MSRFFAASSSSEDEGFTRGGRFGTFEESDSEQTESIEAESSSSSLEEDEEIEEPEMVDTSKRNRFLFGSDSEDEEDDSNVRLVKSLRDKVEETYIDIFSSMEDDLAESNWTGLYSSFERCVKLMAKHPRLVPDDLDDRLLAIEAKISEMGCEKMKKQLPANEAKSFNALNQKLRKLLASRAETMKQQGQVTSKLPGGYGTSLGLDDSAGVQRVIEMTPENALRKLQELIGNRGRRQADRQENIALLRMLFDMSLTDHHRIQIIVAIIAAEFDLVLGPLGYLALEVWLSIVKDSAQLIDLLRSFKMSKEIEHEAEEHGLPNLQSLRGSLLSFIQRLDDEFVKALQIIDFNTSEYEDYLRGELLLYSMLEKCIAYFEEENLVEYQIQAIVRLLDHLYFRSVKVISFLSANSRTVGRLCAFIYRNGTEKAKIRALLYHTYHLALHGHFFKARDIFVSSRISENLAGLDISSQILYNRTVVQLGLAAFQRGHIKDCYFALQEICSSGRPKELLAQGLQSQKHVERTVEQERIERQRQLPSHMHINLELIDAVFLASSMLLEVPQAAASARRVTRGDRKIFQSRHLRRLIDQYDRNLFNGPPENTRDRIICAAKALASGDWARCMELTCSSTLWNLFPNPMVINKMLTSKIKEAGLSSLILAFGPSFTTLNLDNLSKIFDLPFDDLAKIVSCLAQGQNIPVKLDSSHLVWTASVELTPLQAIILQLQDKSQLLLERNEETMDLIQKTSEPTHLSTF